MMMKHKPLINNVFVGICLSILWLLQVACQSSINQTVAPTKPIETIVTEVLVTSSPESTLENRLILEHPQEGTATPNQEITVTPTIVPFDSPWKHLNDIGNFILYNHGNEIFLFQTDGTELFISEGYLFPRSQPWSPDGRQLVFKEYFTSPTQSNNEVAIVSVETGQISHIELLASPLTLHWSPNGRYLLYTMPSDQADNRFKAQLAIYDFEQQDNIILTDVSRIVDVAGWSPDGQEIAFISNINNPDTVTENGLRTYGQFDIYQIDVATLELQQLTNTDDTELFVTWSPTAKLLAFGSSPIQDTWPNREWLFEFWPWVSDQIYLMNELGAIIAEMPGGTAVDWTLDGQVLFGSGGATCFVEISTLEPSCDSIDTPVFDSDASVSLSSDDAWLAVRVQAEETERQCLIISVIQVMPANGEELSIEKCGGGPFYWSPTH